jgi:hypothetical protein
MVKKLLVKIANKIIEKYGTIEIGIGSKVKTHGAIFQIKSLEFEKDYFKTSLRIEACDLIPFSRQDYHCGKKANEEFTTIQDLIQKRYGEN